jgi:hypothetical protein
VLISLAAWHSGQTCKQYDVNKTKDSKETAIQEAASKKLLDKTTKICPNTGFGLHVVKVGGCDHMICNTLCLLVGFLANIARLSVQIWVLPGFALPRIHQSEALGTISMQQAANITAIICPMLHPIQELILELHLGTILPSTIDGVIHL